MGWLLDTSVVVTGAGSGLGRAIVDRFVTEGASVVAFDKSTDKLADLEAVYGDKVATVGGDVREYADNMRACELAVDRFGKLDTFVGNAGIWDFNRSLVDTPATALATGFDELFAVNVKAYLLGAKAAYPALTESHGSMIFTLSNASFYPAGGGALYVASKHAGVGLVKQLAYELAPEIRVNGVAPGGMATDLRGPQALGLDASSITDAFPINAVLEQFSALHRAPQALDYVGPYVLLAARAESSTVTGTVFDISNFGNTGPTPSGSYVPMTAHHVIVGASAAGVSAAVGMRDGGFEGRITLIDASPEVPYERPPLSKLLHAPGPLRPIIDAERYRELGIDLLLGRRVSALDSRRRAVVLDDGDRLQADAVLVATGVLPRRLGVPGEDLPNIFTLRDAADAASITAQLDGNGPLVVVGGGFIGLEAAASARLLGLDVTVIETQPLPLLGPLGPDMASAVLRLHSERGVQFRNGVGVTSFSGAKKVERVLLDDGSSVSAAAVIVGVGVTPQDELARQAGASCDGGILVDRHGRASDGWVWAAGDVARLTNPYVEGRQRIEHWDVALRHGAAVGAGMAGHPTEYSDVPYFWSDQFEHRLQMYGRPRRDDRVVLRIIGDEQVLAFWLRDPVVVAACALNASKDLRTVKALIERRVPVDPKQLIDPSLPLRRMLASQPA